eukprot:1161371-Pelagomonas_calceolata.AAC.2
MGHAAMPSNEGMCTWAAAEQLRGPRNSLPVLQNGCLIYAAHDKSSSRSLAAAGLQPEVGPCKFVGLEPLSCV